ncbi:hypothetical protein CBP12_11040 [Oceanisphaera avium]|uniref:PepSY domain-containing protein n=2 Tax=Oceanisphaera avium TaxID=1903694 RepID=A0A1Y0CZ59_9GAMM|nr:hypothetical protein CBP12_11040 [Oceanisphaera avium]
MKLSIASLLVTATLIICTSQGIADQRHYQQHHQHNRHHQYQNQQRHPHHNEGSRTVVTKEITENGVVIHKRVTTHNGVTYTLDKEIKKGPRGEVNIEKSSEGQLIERRQPAR